ncbi:MAG: sensor histidine kinase [Kiritimatiellae bacterium]|nr:sensor histidine kinase [Kiritimatiellia bacterium]
MMIMITFLTAIALSVQAAAPTVTLNGRTYENWTNVATCVSEVHPMNCMTNAVRRPFSFTGKVVAHTGKEYFFLKDKTGLAGIHFTAKPRPERGDIVKVAGYILQNGFMSQRLAVNRVERIGHVEPEPPIAATPSDVVNGRFNYRMVTLEGVVTDAFRDEIDPDWNWFSIERDGAKVLSCIYDQNLRQETLDTLIDATVSITGDVLARGGRYRKSLSPRVEVPSFDSIKVVERPAPDPFAVNEIRNPSDLLPEAVPRFAHRRRISGRVLATWDGDSLFLMTKEGMRIRVRMKRGEALPSVGSAVTVTGFVRQNVFFEWFDNSLVRIDGENTDPLEAAQPVEPRELLFDKSGEVKIQPQFNGYPIRIRGKAANLFSAGMQYARLDVDCGDITVPVAINGFNPPEIGSLIDVSGICVMRFSPSDGSDAINRLNGFFIVPRDASDIRVIKAPPWWTPARFIMLIGGLLFAILAILAWNLLLQRASERKSRELLKEKATRMKAELSVDERTRLAVELHDSLAQSLTGISLQLDAMEMAGEEDREKAAMHFSAARKTLQSCREGLRYCLRDLRSRSFAETDMNEAISETVRPHIGSTRLAVRFNVPRSRLSDSSAHAVLCIVRELSVNAVRHGGAKNIYIAGECLDGEINFSVRDDGCGFNPDTRPGPAQGHFGLLGVKERINSFGGTLEIRSETGHGTKVTVSLKPS